MSRKEKQAAQLTGSCILAFIVFVVSLWGVNAYKNYMKFSPSNEPGAVDSTSARPVHKTFSSPSEPGASFPQAESPVQYWPEDAK